MKELNEGDRNIIRNLRNEYGEKVAHLDDRVLLERYGWWNQSDKSEPCIDWLLEL